MVDYIVDLFFKRIREVQSLVNEYQEGKRYSIDFNANGLVRGVYFYKLEAGNDFIEARRMFFLQ